MTTTPRAYVHAWLAAAVAAAAGLIAWTAGTDGVTGGLAAPLFLLLTAAAERADLRMPHGRAEEGITLVEAAVAATMLLFSPVQALAIAVCGIALAHATRAGSLLKFAFNLAQYTAATVVAIAAHHLLRGGASPLAWRDVIALAVGMAAFGLVNTVAVSGIVARLEGRPLGAVVADAGRLSVIAVLGNTAIGILAAVLWVSRPELMVLLVVPAFTLQLAYRGVVRSGELLAEVRAERDRLDRIVAGATDGIVLVGADHQVEVWSPAMQRLTGISARDALRRPVGELLAGIDAAGRPVDAAAPLRTPDSAEPLSVVEMRIRHRAGSERVVLARHTVLFDGRGRCTGDIILVHDLTRQVEVEGLKDDFVSRVSHELRTPLTPIKGFAQSLLRRGGDMDVALQRKALEQIVERADHMTRLIDDLLLAARISSSRPDISVPIGRQPADPAELCERSLDVFRIAHPDRDFAADLEPHLPSVIADPLRVEQILTNLLTNACRYSAHGSPVTIHAAWHETDDPRDAGRVSLAVSDQGRGIPPDHLERVFERFHRVEGPMCMETGGMGLGLYIARQLAEAMGGQLTVQSRLGHGSTFTLNLPAARRPARAA